MPPSPDNRIASLAGWLEGRGVNPGHLHDLEPELEALERPPGVFRRWTRAASTFASQQWRHMMGELQESKEVMGIIRRARAGEAVSPAERDQVRSQMHDLLRIAPAGLLVLAFEFFPIPGTGLLAPWALMRLGLMPSRWREAHLLHQLRKEAERLRAEHLDEEAEAVEALERTLTLEGEARDAQAEDQALLMWWDADGDGEWDPEEVAAYEAAVADLQLQLPATRHQKRWFVSWNHHVFGPARLDALVGDAPGGGPLLVRRDDDQAWVRLRDLVPSGAPTAHPGEAG